MVAKGERGGGRMDWESGVSRCKLLHLEWVKNKVLTVQQRRLYPSPCTDHNGKEYLKKNVYMCITESLCYTAKNQYIINQLYFNKKNLICK